MLKKRLKACGLKICNHPAAVAIAESMSNSALVDANALFKLLLQKHSLIYYMLNISDLDLFEELTGDDLLEVEGRIRADTIANIAKLYGHKVINEVHVFLALLQIVPNGFNSQFELIRRGYLARRPEGGPRIQRLLKLAEDMGYERGIAKLYSIIEETPLSRRRVIEDVEGYLSSPYYPYGLTQSWAYRHRKAEVSVARSTAKTRFTGPDHRLLGFLTHGKQTIAMLGKVQSDQLVTWQVVASFKCVQDWHEAVHVLARVGITARMEDDPQDASYSALAVPATDAETARQLLRQSGPKATRGG